jgi:DNA-binding NarL/FixJ family response regulator
MTRVLIVALTSATRVGIRTLLDGAGVEIVGETPTIDDWPGSLAGVEVVVAGEVPALPPPGVRGHADPPRAVVVFGDEAGMVTTLRGLQLEGWGVVSRDATGAELRAAVGAAAQGLVVLPAALVRELGRDPLQVTHRGVDALEEPLTPRELEVLDLMSQGLANKAIGARLGVTENTVKFHVTAVIGKLGASSRTDAVTRGLRRGLIQL